jgi:REP element-mobilizing transposase RayT
MKQRTLFKLSDFSSEFGGTVKAGQRKSMRPLSSRNPVHLVMRADISRSGSLLKYRHKIDVLVRALAQKFGVRVYEYSVVGNHLHFVVLFGSRDSYRKWIRALAGMLAQALKIKWTLRPYTRILNWGRAYKAAIFYVMQNHLEAVGVINYQPRSRRKRLSGLRAGS